MQEKKRQTDKLPSLDDDGKNREKILSKKKTEKKKGERKRTVPFVASLFGP